MTLTVVCKILEDHKKLLGKGTKIAIVEPEKPKDDELTPQYLVLWGIRDVTENRITADYAHLIVPWSRVKMSRVKDGDTFAYDSPIKTILSGEAAVKGLRDHRHPLNGYANAFDYRGSKHDWNYVPEDEKRK